MQRDTKGLYAKALNQEIIGLTGWDDPYEPPTQAEFVLTTEYCTVYESAEPLINFISQYFLEK